MVWLAGIPTRGGVWPLRAVMFGDEAQVYLTKQDRHLGMWPAFLNNFSGLVEIYSSGKRTRAS